MVRLSPVIIIALVVLSGCDQAAAPAEPRESHDAASNDHHSTQFMELVAVLRRADFATSPPSHPELSWPLLAPKIKQVRSMLADTPVLQEPTTARRPLAERASSAHFAELSLARERALVHRAEAARLVAAGYPDAAVDELASVLYVAGLLATWGVPVAAEASAELIEMVLFALQQPLAAPLPDALSAEARLAMLAVLDELNETDPAGRLRSMVESTGERIAALSTLAQGADGPNVVRAAASRYRRGALRGQPEQIERLLDEARSFARALADGWDRPTRSAITQRLRSRQAEDATGVLELAMGDAADACTDDARLRGRISSSKERLR